MPHSKKDTILVSGVTGYVGGRIVPLLLDSNYKVRCLVRDPSRIEGRGWENIEVYKGDALDYETILPALKDVSVAYYLVHSLAEKKGCHERNLIYAQNFGRAAKEAGVKRIIYLLSTQEKDFEQIGGYLRKYGVSVTEFRTSQVIGAGSVSFELIRNIMDKTPVLITSNIIRTRMQPIGIDDVLRYLTDSLEIPESESEIIEIGGSEILAYRDMMLKYAQIQGLKRKIIELPFMTEGLTALLVDFITPIPQRIARSLIAGLKNEVLVSEDTAKKLFNFVPKSYEENVRLALSEIGTGEVITSWQDAYSSFGELSQPIKFSGEDGKFKDRRQITANADLANTFRVISCFGGEEGWLYADNLWFLRGLLDRLFGGVGLRRGRRCPVKLRVGDVLGFWRVEELINNSLLRLRSEMRMKSGAWLQFEVEEQEAGKVVITQTAFFEPQGILGRMYWYSMYPFHEVIFRGMTQTIAKEAEEASRNNPVKALGNASKDSTLLSSSTEK